MHLPDSHVAIIPTTIDTSELYLMIGGHGYSDTRNPCDMIVCVKTQVMGAMYKVRPASVKRDHVITHDKLYSTYTLP
jgi:hypothetical protein